MSDHRAYRVVLVLALLVPPGMAAAQVVVPGARVRVVDVSSNHPLAVGRLVRLVGDSVTILSEANLAAPTAYTVWAVGGRRRLEVRTAVHDQALVGALLGGVAGAAVGYAIGSSAPNNCGNSFAMCIPPASLAAMGGSLLGIVVGGVIGKAFRSEEWRWVDRPPVHLGIAPVSRGMLFTASISF